MNLSFCGFNMIHRTSFRCTCLTFFGHRLSIFVSVLFYCLTGQVSVVKTTLQYKIKWKKNKNACIPFSAMSSNFSASSCVLFSILKRFTNEKLRLYVVQTIPVYCANNLYLKNAFVSVKKAIVYGRDHFADIKIFSYKTEQVVPGTTI